jgi:hypothetical protein
MVPQSEEKDLATAWRALASLVKTEDGWQTIPLVTQLSCRLLAARHFPGNEEAILIGFRSPHIFSNQQLPEGSGFLVLLVDPGPDMDNFKWIALLRQQTGSLEIFTMMTSDIISTLEASAGMDDDSLLRIFLERIRAWQSFMQRARDGALSAEAEIGLHGELIILASILRGGILPHKVIEAWHGPKNGLHDFKFHTGAVEVKATTSVTGFPATISSLEQLDNNLIAPLYLAGVRMRRDESGKNLKERIEEVKELIGLNASSRTSFEILLIHAGYSHLMATRYPRRFIHSNTLIFLINNIFPKLTRGNVPAEILKVQYQIDLDQLDCFSVSLGDIVPTLGRL